MNLVALVKKHGSVKAVAKIHNIPYSTLKNRYRTLVRNGKAPSVAPPRYSHEDLRAIAEDVNNGRSWENIATAWAVSRDVVRRLVDRAKKAGYIDNEKPEGKSREDVKRIVKAGKVKALQPKAITKERKRVRRYLFTSAQNDTQVHEGFWNNLLAFKEFMNAELHVARYTYVKQGLGAKGDKKQLKPAKAGEGKGEMIWDHRLDPYLSDERLRVAEGLVWCGEMNILPTASRPLSGLEVYTGRDSAIFPHSKLAMECVASNKNEPTKINYTTGACTLRNYIHRKAGLKAEFHHAFSALIVEVDENEDWFVRQLNATDDGAFQDLDVIVKGGEISEGNHVLAINFGDDHVKIMDPTVRKVHFAPNGMVDTLYPRYKFHHDVLDFRGRSHHEMKDPHTMFKRYVTGEENVRKEVWETAQFLQEESYRDWCQTIIVDSNHHHHLGRWLKEANGMRDPVNAEFWTAMQARVLSNIRRGVSVNYLKESFLEVGGVILQGMYFLNQDESFILKGIEFGLHGDLGAGGSRGNPLTFARMGRRMNIGHHHGKAGIYDGVYVAGTSSVIMPDWTAGPDSWTQSDIITYPNGKRTIVTIWNGKWRVPR